MTTLRRYFTRRGQKVNGPFTAAVLRSLAEAGELIPTDQVRVDGSENWVPASHVRGLFVSRVDHASPLDRESGHVSDPQTLNSSLAREVGSHFQKSATVPSESQVAGKQVKSLAQSFKSQAIAAANATYDHIRAVVAYLASHVTLLFERRQTRAAVFELGELLYQEKMGDHGLSEEIRKLAGTDLPNATTGTSQSSAHTALLVRLAEHYMDRSKPERDSTLWPAFEKARRARDTLVRLSTDTVAKKRKLAVTNSVTAWRLLAGYGAICVLLIACYSVFVGRNMQGRGSVHDQWAAIWEAQRESQEQREQDRTRARERLAEQKATEERAKNERVAELQALVKKANRLLVRNRFSDAIAVYQEVLAEDPEFADAHNGRGMVSLSLCQWADAAKSFDLAIKGNPNFLLAYLNRAKCRVMLGQPLLATHDLDRAIQMDPSWAELYCWRAHAHRENKRYTEALRDIESALKLDVSRPEPYFIRGAIRLDNAEDLDRAIQDFTTAIQFDKRLTMAYVLRGTAKVRRKDFDGAIQDFESATKVDPNLDDAFYNLALAAATSGQHELAVKNFTETLRHLNQEEKNRQWEVYLARGESYLELSKFKEAEADFTRVLSFSPRSDAAYENRAMARKALNDPKAEDDLKIVADLRRPPEAKPEKKVAAGPSIFERGAWALSPGTDYYFNRASSYTNYSTQSAMRDYRSQMAGQLGVMGYAWAR
jgi:tetratricopeptide (TPR) repeat protein